MGSTCRILLGVCCLVIFLLYMIAHHLEENLMTKLDSVSSISTRIERNISTRNNSVEDATKDTGTNVEVSLNEEHFDESCNEKFNDTLQDNLLVIERYPHGEADPYMWKMGTYLKRPLTMEKYPVLVTAFSRHYYQLARGLFHTFLLRILGNERYGGNIKIIVYDLGMTRRQKRIIIASFCRCEIRPFSFDEFPQHVKTLRYHAWKPIIIQTLLMEFGSVWWADVSVRFPTRTVDGAFAAAEKYGIVFNLEPPEASSIVSTTDVNTLRFLGEDVCKFQSFSQVDVSSLIIRFDETNSALIKVWAQCALQKQCIAPSDESVRCDSNNQQVEQCHNFEQSVFSILFRRLFHEHSKYDFNSVLDKYIVNNRSDWDHLYFEDCPDKFCLM